ncbi:MAG: MaoC family dehydratase [Spirochaetaceae bacterium]|nr:MaoC family dehydratase [Spirochaetaceae bacterium]
MSIENRGLCFEEIKLGMKARFAKTVTEADIANFAGVSGDFNPVHVDEEFASTTRFKGRIAHGMLSAAFISTVFGTKLPGPGAIYVSQNLKFKAPVRIGDTVTAEVQVIDLTQEKNLVTFKTVCTVRGKVVVDGEAVLLVPSMRSDSPLTGLADESRKQPVATADAAIGS